MKNEMKWKRLTILAEYLKEVKPQQFFYGDFVDGECALTEDGKQLSCGTTACAIGHVPVIPEFRRLGVRFGVEEDDDYRSLEPMLKMDGKFIMTSWEDVGETIFGLDRDEFYYLFMPAERFGHSNGLLPSPGYNASAKTVAKHILKFVRWDQKRVAKEAR